MNKAAQRKRSQALDMKIKGATHEQIAEVLGVTRARVQQLLRPPKAVYDFVRKRAGARCQQCGFELENGNVYGPGDDIEKLEYLCDEHFASRYREHEVTR